MLEFNRGTKKLLKILDKMQENLRKEIAETIEKKLSNKASMALVLSTKSNVEIFEEHAGTRENIERELKLLRKTNPELEYRFQKINWIHILISKGHAFNEYDILEQIFDELDFDVNYRIEVLGYLLKQASIGFLNLEKEMEEERRKNGIIDIKFFEKIFNSEVEYSDPKIDKEDIAKLVSKMQEEDFLNDTLEIIKNYKIIMQYIDENGNFIGQENVEPLKEALGMKQIRMPENQKELIVKTVVYRFKEQKVKETSGKNIPNQSEAGQPTKKEKYQASQLLKALLINEMPKDYISEADMLTITNAMVILNYTDEQITKIQRNIIKSNLEIETLQQTNKLESAKIKYLTPEQLNLFDCVETLINSNEPLINSFYEKIVENQQFIKRELLNILNNSDDSEEAALSKELISLAFEEMKSVINSYCYSDYRFVLELTKKESE